MTKFQQLVRIRQQLRSAMQSGHGRAGWIIDCMSVFQLNLDPLTGWLGSVDPRRQVERRFESLADAMAYAEAHDMQFEVCRVASGKAVQPKVYADNFRTNRHDNWTH